MKKLFEENPLLFNAISNFVRNNNKDEAFSIIRNITEQHLISIIEKKVSDKAVINQILNDTYTTVYNDINKLDNINNFYEWIEEIVDKKMPSTQSNSIDSDDDKTEIINSNVSYGITNDKNIEVSTIITNNVNAKKKNKSGNQKKTDSVLKTVAIFIIGSVLIIGIGMASGYLVYNYFFADSGEVIEEYDDEDSEIDEEDENVEDSEIDENSDNNDESKADDIDSDVDNEKQTDSEVNIKYEDEEEKQEESSEPQYVKPSGVDYKEIYKELKNHGTLLTTSQLDNYYDQIYNLAIWSGNVNVALDEGSNEFKCEIPVNDLVLMQDPGNQGGTCMFESFDVYGMPGKDYILTKARCYYGMSQRSREKSGVLYVLMVKYSKDGYDYMPVYVRANRDEW